MKVHHTLEIQELNLYSHHLVYVASIRPVWLCKPFNNLYIFCVPLTQEPMDVVELFGLKGVQHTPISIKNARVSQVNRFQLPI